MFAGVRTMVVREILYLPARGERRRTVATETRTETDPLIRAVHGERNLKWAAAWLAPAVHPIGSSRLICGQRQGGLSVFPNRVTETPFAGLALRVSGGRERHASIRSFSTHEERSFLGGRVDDVG